MSGLDIFAWIVLLILIARAGEVIDVPVEPNAPLKAGDVLFRIDPVPFESQAKALEAQLRFQDLRLSQMTQLQERDAGRAFDVQQRQSEVDQLKAQLENAKWNLDKTVVRQIAILNYVNPF